MSRSPRKLVRQAATALDDLAAVLTRYADARADAEARIGADGVADLAAMRDRLRSYADQLDGPVLPGEEVGATR